MEEGSFGWTNQEKIHRGPGSQILERGDKVQEEGQHWRKRGHDLHHSGVSPFHVHSLGEHEEHIRDVLNVTFDLNCITPHRDIQPRTRFSGKDPE